MDDRFDNLLDDATAGLKDDPELRLDVRAELASHLAETADAYQAAGHAPDESAALAAKDFGSPLDLAADLRDANTRRMKTRALIRLALNALVIPLAVVVAVWVVYGRVARAYNTGQANLFAQWTGYAWYTPSYYGEALPWFTTAKDRQRAQALKTMEALQGTPNNISSLRAYWQAHQHEPGSEIFYAYYANFYMPPSKPDPAFVQAMRFGEEVEPGNALYNYRLALYYLIQGVQSRDETVKKDDDDVILDAQAMELGLAEYRKALTKPYLRTYHAEIITRKAALLPPPRLTEDYTFDLSIRASELYPELAGYRNLSRKVTGSARLLAAQGRRQDAEALIQGWQPYALHLTRDATTFIELLVAMANGAIVGKGGADLYDEWGQPAKATQVRRDLDTLMRPKTERRRLMPSDMEGHLQRNGAQMVSILLPVFGLTPSIDELAPARMHEHTLVEEFALYGLLALLTLAMLLSLLQSAVWYGSQPRAGRGAPLLLMPSWGGLARVLGWGVGVPLAVYALLSRLPAISGREYAFGYLWPRFAVEIGLLALALLVLPPLLAGRQVRRRCSRLGVPVPPRRSDIAQKLIFYFAPVVVARSIGLSAYYLAPYGDDRLAMLIIIADVVLLILAVLALIWAGRARARYALYHGTVARSLAPVYAAAILLLAFTVHPYLLRTEQYWLQQDTLLFPKPGQTVGFTPIEDRAVEAWKAEMLKALE